MLINKKLAAALATGAILLATVSPAFADTAVGNLDNGAESSSAVTVTQNNNSTATQKNAATITNDITSSSSTGGNNTNFNTNGNNQVYTGSASNAVNVSNTANDNQMSNPSANNGGNTLLKNGGNGAFSVNAANLTSNNNANASQNNAANFRNTIDSSASTGNNSGSDNTGGNTSLFTGPAKNVTDVVNQANQNVMTGGNAAFGFGGGTTLENNNNGAITDNSVAATENNSATATQANTATFGNIITGGAFTGKNKGNFNTDGSTAVMTGSALNWTGVSNTANNNVMNEAAGNCGCALTNHGNLVENAGNGSFSSSAANATMNNNQTAAQANAVDFSNLVDPSAFTGKNSASDTTGSFWFPTGSSVMTGNSASQTDVSNTSNENVMSNGVTLAGVNFNWNPAALWSGMNFGF